jgi:hypothetical protein
MGKSSAEARAAAGARVAAEALPMDSASPDAPPAVVEGTTFRASEGRSSYLIASGAAMKEDEWDPTLPHEEHINEIRGSIARLEWVVVDGQFHHVSAFASLKPRQRPIASCPACDRQVTLKLGGKRRHHAAHHPDASCSATSRETILHLNTKLYLADRLKSFRGPLGISFPCADCSADIQQDWIENWIDVHVERQLFQRRPDILVSLDESTAAAIEIHHTHAVTDEKRKDLEATGTPWIEVDARSSIYSGKDAWQPTNPLPIRAWSKGPDLLCPTCVDTREARARASADYKLRTEKERRRRIDRIEQYVEASIQRLQQEQLSGRVIYRLRIVDTFWPSGKKFRELLALVGDRRRDEETIQVIRGSDGKVLGRTIKRTRIRDFERDLAAPALDILRARARVGQGIVDSPMDWANIYERLKAHPRKFLNHWTDHLDLMQIRFIKSIDDEPSAEDLDYAADPLTGEVFERPSLAPQLPASLQAITPADSSIILSMLSLQVQFIPMRRYVWYRNSKWILPRAHRTVHWDTELERILWLDEPLP